MVAILRIASPSLGTILLYVPHTFSQVSMPTPLIHADWISSVWFFDQRLQTCVILLPSNHFHLSTMRFVGYVEPGP